MLSDVINSWHRRLPSLAERHAQSKIYRTSSSPSSQIKRQNIIECLSVSVSGFSIFFNIYLHLLVRSPSLLNFIDSSRHTSWINYDYAFWFAFFLSIFPLGSSDDFDSIMRYYYSCKCSQQLWMNEGKKEGTNLNEEIFSMMTHVELDVNHNSDLL